MGNEIKITFLGDLMCEEPMLKCFQKETGGYDFRSLFEDVAPYLSESDLVMANLETPISYNNSDLTREKYCFNSPFEFAKDAYEAGIRFFSTANNHCLDRGIAGIVSTIKSLDKIGAYHTGVFDNKLKEPCIIDVNGVRIGVLSYTYGTNAFANRNYLPKKEYWRVNLFQNQELSGRLARYCFDCPESNLSVLCKLIERFFHPINLQRPVYERKEASGRCKRELRKNIRRLRKENPDVIVMFMHAGGQFNSEATKDTKELASYLMKQGVGIVAGTHEHVVHGGDFSRYADGKAVAYSLGDFDYFPDSEQDEKDMPGYSVAWNVYLDKKGTETVIKRMTYSILKTIYLNDNPMGIKVVPAKALYDLLTDEKEKTALWNDMQKIAIRFSGKEIESYGVCGEYDL